MRVDSESFWSFVDKSGDCWLWTGSARNGHGWAVFGGRERGAERIAWLLTHGTEASRDFSKTCGNRACVRPEHMMQTGKARNRRGISLLERLEASSVPEPNTGCVLWTGRINKYGYGVARDYDSRMRLAHRLSWSQHNGPIPDGMLICHKCDTRACINPDHLFLGSHADNIHDMIRKGRGRGRHSVNRRESNAA